MMKITIFNIKPIYIYDIGNYITLQNLHKIKGIFMNDFHVYILRMYRKHRYNDTQVI